MDPSDIVVAAGAVVLRRSTGRSQALLVHRPKYDDWSFPKGKLDPGETIRAAAVREVFEETGLEIALGPPLSSQTYLVGPQPRRAKVVHYWVGRARDDEDVEAYEPNDEIDDLRWVDVDEAPDLLSYDYDRETLTEAVPFVRRTYALAIVRHAQALPRNDWEPDDQERPLTDLGRRQAEALTPTLSAYGIDRLVSSSSRRCWTTLAPYGVEANLHIEETDELSEEDATDVGIGEEIEWLVDLRESVAVCSHRPVLPLLFDALNVDPPSLDLAGMVVVHHRQGRIAALEHLPAPSAD
ncbi:MAG: 8-oxo-(d)GTP phosphatase [Nocardioidaceae bacterium]|nr:8-oxo-(d)GTP phosphatase [Nocardioidaceae bacterium]